MLARGMTVSELYLLLQIQLTHKAHKVVICGSRKKVKVMTEECTNESRYFYALKLTKSGLILRCLM